MSTVKSELLALMTLASEKLAIPRISQVYMPEPQPAPDKDSEFGIIVLADDSAGLYYAWMGEAQAGMNARYPVQDFIGLAPLELVHYYESDHEADRSIGLAAINAISQSVFRQLDCVLPPAGNSLGELQLQTGDRLGMVGYFPSLLRQLRQTNIPVTVIEKKSQFVQQDDLVTVTTDIRELAGCNKILSTAATMLNDSIDEVLDFCRHAEVIVVVGPTAGFLPGPLFRRGVSAIGGSQVIDVPLALTRLGSEQGLGDAARKYLLRPEGYRTVADRLAAG